MNDHNDDGGLSGGQLVALLDRLGADLDEADAEQINLLARLEAQPLRPDTLESLFRLCALWWEAEQPARALQIVARDGQALLARTLPTEQADTWLHLALLDATTAFVMRDEPTAVAALRRATEAVTQSGASLLWRDGGGPVEVNCDGYREWDVLFELTDWTLDTTLAVFDLRWALDSTDPELADRRAVSEVLFHAARAQAYHGHARPEPAVDEASQALRLMSAIAAPQVVDRDNWLTLADAIVDIVPGSLLELTPGISLGSQSLVPALRSELTIRLARLQARALYAQGDKAGALALRGVTTCSLEQWGVGEDDFFEYDVPWLVEAQRYDEAGERVAMYIYLFALSDARVDIIRPLINQRLADETDRSVWWPLCVMRLCAYGGDLLEKYLGELGTLSTKSSTHARLFGALAQTSDLDQAARQIFADARRLADERSPHHPWTERFSILIERQQGLIDDAQVAARFEALVAGGLNDGPTLVQYVSARLAAFGLPKALYIALPDAPSGSDTLRCAVVLNDGQHSCIEAIPVGLEAMIDECPDDVRRVNHAIWHAMYCHALEQGVARMEQFFASGVGHPGDANPHYYSRLCSALAMAIVDDRRFDEAIALSLKGLQASPEPGHYVGILYIVNAMRIAPDIWKAMDAATQTSWRQYYVTTAEILWRYIAEEGYSRSRPNEWIHLTVMHLHYLDRYDEIPLWLERLIRWQEEGADEDPEHLSGESLYARARCLQYLSNVVTHRTMCQALAEPLKAQIAQSTDRELLAVAGVVFGNLDQLDAAVFFYERHLQLNPRATAEDLKWAQDITRNLADCRARLDQARRTR